MAEHPVPLGGGLDPQHTVVEGYRDLLRDNDEAYVAFHRRMTDRGFLMLPLALKRNHISAAHTEADIDRTLDAAREVLRSIRDDGLLS